MEILTVLIWALCGWACHSMAKKQGRDATLGAVLGVLFGVFGIIGYAIAGDKKTNVPPTNNPTTTA